MRKPLAYFAGMVQMAGGRNSTTQAVQKAMHLLSCFTEPGATTLGVAELSRRTGWAESSVSRLLSALEDSGFVEQEPATGRYLPGLRLVALATVALAARPLHAVCHPHLEKLAAASGETADLCVLEGDTALVIDEVVGTHAIKASGWIGTRHLLHAAAAGKVLLAALPAERRAALLSHEPRALTPHTVTDRARLLDQVEHIRAVGYALSVEEVEVGLTAIAAPVVDHAGAVVAALALAGPSFRLVAHQLDACIALVRTEARDASRRFGHHMSVA